MYFKTIDTGEWSPAWWAIPSFIVRYYLLFTVVSILLRYRLADYEGFEPSWLPDRQSGGRAIIPVIHFWTSVGFSHGLIRGHNPSLLNGGKALILVFTTATLTINPLISGRNFFLFQRTRRGQDRGRSYNLRFNRALLHQSSCLSILIGSGARNYTEYPWVMSPQCNCYTSPQVGNIGFEPMASTLSV